MRPWSCEFNMCFKMFNTEEVLSEINMRLDSFTSDFSKPQSSMSAIARPLQVDLFMSKS